MELQLAATMLKAATANAANASGRIFNQRNIFILPRAVRSRARRILAACQLVHRAWFTHSGLTHSSQGPVPFSGGCRDTPGWGQAARARLVEVNQNYGHGIKSSLGRVVREHDGTNRTLGCVAEVGDRKAKNWGPPARNCNVPSEAGAERIKGLVYVAARRPAAR